MFINEEAENLKVVIDVGGLLEIITKRKSQKFFNSLKIHSVTNAIHNIEVSMIFLLVTNSFFMGRY